MLVLSAEPQDTKALFQKFLSGQATYYDLARMEGWPYQRTQQEFSQLLYLLPYELRPEALEANRETLGRLYPDGEHTHLKPVDPEPLKGFLDPAAVIAQNPFKGADRIKTGIPSIDDNTRGGFPVGSVITFQGKPGSCKTALAIQIAVKAAREQGAVIIGLFPDEGRLRAAVRVGQNLGLDRAKLEDGEDAETEQFSKLIEPLTIMFPDPDNLETTIDKCVETFKLPEFEGRLKILLVDSTQTARADSVDPDGEERLRLTAIMSALRRAAMTGHLLVLNISQVNRSSYRNKNDADNADPLSGGMGSASIEFLSDALYHLDGKDKTDIRARTPKSRLGPEPSWRMLFDRTSATLSEIDEGEAKDEQAAEFQAAVLRAEVLIKETLRKYPDGLHATPLLELACSGVRKAIYLAARKALLESNVLFAEVEGKNTRYKLSVQP